MAWNRKRIIDFCNEEIFPKVNNKAWSGIAGELINVIELVTKFRKNNGYPQEMTATVEDGFLTINNIPVGRIARSLNTPYYDWCSDGAYYWEGRILARQEVYCD